MISKTFPANHAPFYQEFDVWRKEMKLKSAPQGGIYIFKASKEICRLLKADPEGIFYIGKGDILSNNNRVGKFVNSLNNTETIHAGGNRFNFGKIRMKYPIENSTIEIILTPDPEKMEAERLIKYVEVFGELPPFNRRLET